MKIFELIIDKLDELTGVEAVALVQEPAIRADFFAFNSDVEDIIAFQLIKNEVFDKIQHDFVDRIPGESKQDYIARCVPQLLTEGYDQDQALAICYDTYVDEEKLSEKPEVTMSNEKMSFAVVEDQQMVVGPLMIPDKLILRVDENQEPYYVYFSKDTIKQIAEKVMKENLMHKLNIEHNTEDVVDGYMVSTWIVEDELKDKQQVYGFNHPVGSWMGQYKIQDKQVWKKIKNGEIKGFSVEGYFGDRFIQAKRNNI